LFGPRGAIRGYRLPEDKPLAVPPTEDAQAVHQLFVCGVDVTGNIFIQGISSGDRCFIWLCRLE
jgi:hypothetical protein